MILAFLPTPTVGVMDVHHLAIGYDGHWHHLLSLFIL
jgi:hypothetical protein